MSNSYETALKIKSLPINHPQISGFPNFGLRFQLYPYQIQGVLYMYAAKRCILADATGLGKTAQCLGLMKLIESQKKEDNRWVIVAPPPTILQWAGEFEKFTDFPKPILGIFGRQNRINSYMIGIPQSMIISYQVLLRDWDILSEQGITNWIFDDAHFFRHHNTKTAKIVKALTRNSNRVILSTATPMQKNPKDLHSLLEALGLGKVFGTEVGFENHYCVMRTVNFAIRHGIIRKRKEFVRARNLDELKQKVNPFMIQRTFMDCGKFLPELIVKPIWLGMTELQTQLQEQLHKRMMEAWDKGELVKIRNIGFHAQRQLCAGTKTLGLETDESTKLDAVIQFVEDKLGENEKVLIYSFYKKTVAAIADRLTKIGRTDFEVITGDITSKPQREYIRKRFMEDPTCRILIGTDALKVGLNLQSARYLIMVDLILNAQEIMQLIGRIRRLGSKNKNVVLYILLTTGTIEERLFKKLKYEAALYDIVFGKTTSIFPALDSMEIAALMGLPVKEVHSAESQRSSKETASVTE